MTSNIGSQRILETDPKLFESRGGPRGAARRAARRAEELLPARVPEPHRRRHHLPPARPRRTCAASSTSSSAAREAPRRSRAQARAHRGREDAPRRARLRAGVRRPPAQARHPQGQSRIRSPRSCSAIATPRGPRSRWTSRARNSRSRADLTPVTGVGGPLAQDFACHVWLGFDSDLLGSARGGVGPRYRAAGQRRRPRAAHSDSGSRHRVHLSDAPRGRRGKAGSLPQVQDEARAEVSGARH